MARKSRLSVLFDGFYDKRGERMVTESMRTNLLARSNGRCEKCRRKFTGDGDGRFTVQHTAASEGFVLEAWCYRCNMEDAQSVVRELSAEDKAFLREFEFRTQISPPALVCDDHENWWPTIYKQMQAKRRQIDSAISQASTRPRKQKPRRLYP
jgi:hypothetical protein